MPTCQTTWSLHRTGALPPPSGAVVRPAGLLGHQQSWEHGHLGQRLPPHHRTHAGAGVAGHQAGACCRKHRPEHLRDPRVLGGAALNIRVLPVTAHHCLRLLLRDLPLQVSLVAHHHQRQVRPPRLHHQVPQPCCSLKGGEIGHAVDQEHGIGGGEGHGEHGGEVLGVGAAGVLEVQL